MSSPVVVVSKFEDFKTGEEDEEYIRSTLQGEV